MCGFQKIMDRDHNVRSLCIIMLPILIHNVHGITEKLPSLIVRGTYTDVGFQVGHTFRDNIQSYYREHPLLRPVWLPWSQTPQGQKVLQEFLEVEKMYFPQYIEELKGMAKGANVSFTEMFLANHYVEMGAIFANKSSKWHKTVDSCSDIFVNRPDKNCVVLGHNEDNTPLIQNKSYLLMATITDQSGYSVLEEFTAFCYPGQLPGNAFGFNREKVMTVNGLYPKLVKTSRVGRSFITRAILVTSDFSTSLSIAKKSSAYGLSINIGTLPRSDKPARLYNMEVAPNDPGPQSVTSVREITPTITMDTREGRDKSWQEAIGWAGNGTDYHVNMYRRLSIAQIPSHVTSSIHRTARIEAFPPPFSNHDVVQILGDTSDSHYPIYRHPQPTDEEATLATGVFDLLKCTLSIYQDNPKTSPGSLIVLPLNC